MNYFIYTSHHFTPHGRFELNKLASLPMCGFIAQLVEHRTGIAEVTGSIPWKPWLFQASFFQLLKLENLLRWSFFTLIYNRSSNIGVISNIIHIINSQCLWMWFPKSWHIHVISIKYSTFSVFFLFLAIIIGTPPGGVGNSTSDGGMPLNPPSGSHLQYSINFLMGALTPWKINIG